MAFATVDLATQLLFDAQVPLLSEAPHVTSQNGFAWAIWTLYGMELGKMVGVSTHYLTTCVPQTWFYSYGHVRIKNVHLHKLCNDGLTWWQPKATLATWCSLSA